jgi:TfoX/Sxy family transcriptional regulator of competence genes
MAYNIELADQLREALLPLMPVTEKKMFGSIIFMLNGNMLAGVSKEDLIFRVGMEQREAALKLKGAKVFDLTGKPMKGWVMVSREGCDSKHLLEKWILMANEFVKTLPAK